MLTLQDDNTEPPEFQKPPSMAEHKKRFGAQLLDGLCGSSDDEKDLDAQRKKDEEAPKPTVDVLMSRNLRSGAGKGFNFGMMSGSDSDDKADDVPPMVLPTKGKP